MGQYFALILNNSVTVSILIAVLLVFRGLCKKISRRMICFLWIVAAIKLIVPIQIESQPPFIHFIRSIISKNTSRITYLNAFPHLRK